MDARGDFIFTSESVTEGHPDKVCDIISDAVLDAALSEDPLSRVACETTVCTGMVHVMGEITTEASISYDDIVRNVLKDIGYNSDTSGFNGNLCSVVTTMHKQSPDIARGVNTAQDSTKEKILGAGDQGLMFGFACDETPELMPMPIQTANTMAKCLTEVRKKGQLTYLLPDGKTQVSVVYENGFPKRIATIVIAAQHLKEISQSRIKRDLEEFVIKPCIPEDLWSEESKVVVNGTGRFVNGGPGADSGLTGRKIIVDTYGGYARHGGGAFSGKDPTKVDRSGNYFARYLAKNIVASEIATQCEVQIAYAIGVAEPVSLSINTFGTAKNSTDEMIKARILECFDMRPGAIIERFNLQRPIYKPLAAYGHFGRRDLDLPWEQTDSVNYFI